MELKKSNFMFNSVAREKGLNREKNWFKRMAEWLKENQYRITIVIISLAYMLGLAYLLILINKDTNFSNFFNMWVNYVLIIAGILVYYRTTPLIKQIWKQIDIRDNTELLTQYKLMKDIGIELTKEELEQLKKEILEKPSPPNFASQPLEKGT